MTKSFSKHRPRIVTLFVLVMVAWSGLTVRFFHIQVVRGGELAELEKQQGENRVVLPAVRGTIFDRNMAPLAENVLHYSFGVHPDKVKDPEVLIRKFADATGKSEETFRRAFSHEGPFVYLERNLRSDRAQNLLPLEDEGLIVHRHGYRFYPHRAMASQVLGFTSTDNIGLEGVEKEFDAVLRGRDGWIILQTDGKGRTRRNEGYPRQEPVDGSDVVLTIDLEYQAILQDELSRRMTATGSRAAQGIIMEPSTGKILAMASLPDFDPNDYLSWPRENYRNRIITDQFEPGSTLKLVPATAALTLGTVSMDQEFNCEDGSYNFRGTVIRDWSDFGLLTFPQIIENSSNVGIIKIAETVGPQNLYLFARKYGFGVPSGIRLPGEARGVLKPVKEWSALSLAEVSLGHEISVTTLQLALAYSAVANGGKLMKPSLVERIVHPRRGVVYRWEPQVVRQVAPTDVMTRLTEMFTRVVNSGTGTSARIEGWNVAGKTGTAQKYVEGAYSTTRFVSSFVGFLPANDPRLVAAIVLDEPKGSYHWGGIGPAPVFKKVMKRIVNSDDAIWVHHPPPPGPVSRPAVQTRATGVREETAPVSLMTSAAVSRFSRPPETVRVPNVRGQSLRRAIVALKRAGLKPMIRGSGKVTWQSPAPGTRVKVNTPCTIGLQ
ncbi:MAG: penicillin-binding protein [Fidelibacterota bacterium]